MARRVDRILCIAEFYLPGFKSGGPIRSISAVVGLLRSDFSAAVVTRDRDCGDRSRYPGVPIDRWMRVNGAPVTYLPTGLAGAVRMFRVLRRTGCDVLYLSGVFSRTYSMLPLTLRRLRLTRYGPVIIAPRGQFLAPALAIKPRRKAAFLWIAGRIGLFDGCIWQVSSDDEERSVRTVLRYARVVRLPIVRAEDIATAQEANAGGSIRRSDDGVLRLLFVGRVSRVKNLDGLIRAMHKVRVPVHLDIVGPEEDPGYLAECLALLSDLPSHVGARYLGPLPPTGVADLLRQADCTIVPSYSENFGHVVLEALVNGCPVITTTGTPWRFPPGALEGVTVEATDTDGMAAAIDHYGRMDPDTRAAARESARESGRVRSRSTEARRETIGMFRAVAALARSGLERSALNRALEDAWLRQLK